ncbi:ORFB hypothetical protein [Psittacine adenovirus 2]|nr:ORFB hypothetical protein [Psittacine adenovirus 2]
MCALVLYVYIYIKRHTPKTPEKGSRQPKKYKKNKVYLLLQSF